MAQYQRFLSYLFEYEGDQKKENCGFAKIEIRGDVQRIFLSVKNNEQAEILHVFGFYHTKDGCDCVPLGRMVVKNGKGQLQYINNGVYLAGSEIKFEQLSGTAVNGYVFKRLLQLSGMIFWTLHCLRRIGKLFLNLKTGFGKSASGRTSNDGSLL